MDNFTVSIELNNTTSWPYQRFMAAVAEGGLSVIVARSYATDESAARLIERLQLDQPFLATAFRGSYAFGHWASGEALYAASHLGNASINLQVAATSSDGAIKVLDAVGDAIDPPTVTGPAQVRMAFWHLGSNGAESVTRRIDAHAWADIRTNYPATEPIEALLAHKPEGSAGKIAVLHGPPGTGKTSLIRCLASEWRDWCRFEYVSDPEDFFRRAGYLLEVLLEAADADDPDDDEQPRRRGPKWRMLVIEDAEELIVPEAKERTGQGVARLLNLGDGLIGQGLRIMVLITTNQPVASLNEAIMRPGRCFADIQVPFFSARAARAWLSDHGADGDLIDRDTTYSLADLYALKEHRRPARRYDAGGHYV